MTTTTKLSPVASAPIRRRWRHTASTASRMATPSGSYGLDSSTVMAHPRKGNTASAPTLAGPHPEHRDYREGQQYTQEQRGSALPIVQPGHGQDRRRQGKAGVQRGDAAVARAGDDETLIEVPAMRLEHVLAAEQPTQKGSERVEQERPHQRRGAPGEPRRIDAARPGDQHQGQHREREAEEPAAHVAH